MIELLNGFPDKVVAVSCKGNVTREDYETVLIPRVAEALKAHDKVRLYYEIGTDYAGIEPGAIWEDMKTGMAHLTRWERIAVVTDVLWIRNVMQMFSFMIPAEMRFYGVNDAGTARAWIEEGAGGEAA